ncbi:hypothetical protein TSUD_85470 [Trifolium subterraneum]|uniref:Legume lectin domain-containing protein n=1 Tax=Trifolium subterraneum TaxID=3900 RepID=A0A2Z6P5F8_TRISU|nr:hypothetical protein TSUD_85470 [Trifolium subterraneum]
MTPLHVSFHTQTIVFCYAIGTISTLQLIHFANSLSFDYPYFNNGDVNWEGDASPYKGAIQVTSNTIDQNNNYSVGRVTSFKQMHLWDLNSGKLSDFTTKFSFVVFSKTKEYGDGMAFFLSDPNLPLLKNIKEGGGLGLVDGDQVLKSTQHSFVAVEFDTYNNPWDPSGEGTHVGLNFNSMRSNITKPWLTNILKWRSYNCSIKYNSSTLNLRVSFTMYDNDDKPVEEHISHNVDLRDFLPERVIVGFSAATGILYEVHTLRSWSFSSSLLSDENRYQIAAPTSSPVISEQGNKIGLKVGIGIGTGLAVSLSGLVCTLLWKRSRGRKSEFGKATKESDIYSFGVVLLEIATGRKAIEREEKEGQISVVEWVWDLYGFGKFLQAADPKLCGAFDEQQLEHLVIVGLWCVHPDYSFRPSIRQVIQVLKFESSLPILPEKMPVPTYLPPSIKALFSSVSSTYWTKS